MKPIVRRLLKLLGAALGLCLLAVGLVAAALFAALRAGPDDWSERVAIGPLRIDASVLASIRIATHPLGMRALEGRSLQTSVGRLHFAEGPVAESLRIVCDPCVIAEPALSAQPLHIAPAEATVLRSGANDLHGEVRAGALRGTWAAHLRARDVALEVAVPDSPVAGVYALFADAIPELARARLEGRFAADLKVALPSRRLSLKPRIEGFVVDGLGTESLIGASPLPACAKPTRRADASARFGAWLPKAVVAAEDQRFFEHPGYDLAEMAAAWSSPDANAREAHRGASTLSQQLAKLLFTGEERTVARKLRELLYAVELDRTLGKQRALSLYLSIAPWGAERCGAEAAALHWFGKRAATLGPIESAWLASLLRNPDAELRRAAQDRAPDRKRMEAILAGMHPILRQRRKALLEELQTWEPPVLSPTQ